MSYTTIEHDTTALLLFDALNAYYRGADDAVQRKMEPVVVNMARVVDACRPLGIPVFYAKADHRADGLDSAALYTDTSNRLEPWPDPEDKPFRAYRQVASGTWRAEVIEEVAAQEGDYMINKHRWSAFHQTHLELSLRTRGIDTIILCGGATEVGIASTAYSARDHDFNLVIVSDATLAGNDGNQESFMDRVFPFLSRVRTTDEVLQMLKG